MRLRTIIILALGVLVVGFYGYRVYDFKQEMKERRAEHDDAFIAKLAYYEPPAADSWTHPSEAFKEKNFEKLESLAVEYTADQGNPDNGMPAITRYYLALELAADDEMQWEDVFQTTQAWRAKYPDSHVARIVHAKQFIHYAWDARGDGAARTVSRENYQLFYERLKQALAIIKEIPEEDLKQYPDAACCYLTCLNGLGLPRKDFTKLYFQLAETFPDYVNLHMTAAHFSTPSWGGAPGEWERNLRQAIKHLSAEKSAEVYADTIYRMVRRGHGYGQSFVDTMQAAKIDETKLKKGLISLSKKEGDGVYYHSALAHFALRHENDAKACRDWLEKTGWKIDSRIWQSEKTFDVVCRNWLTTWFYAYAANSDEYESKMSPLKIFGG